MTAITGQIKTRSNDVGPYSPRPRLRRLDGRTRAGKFLASTERALLDHASRGGAVPIPVTTRILCQRVAADLLRLEMLDEKFATGTATDHDGRVAHALRGSVRLALKDLGLDAPPPRPTAPTFHQGRGIADILREEGRS